MSNRIIRCLLLLACATIALWCQEQLRTDQAPYRILVTTGGHPMNEARLWDMFAAIPGLVVTKATMPKDAGLLKPGLEQQYDALVLFDMAIMDEAYRAPFLDLLNTGIGVVALHHNLGAEQNWDEYRNIIGGKYILPKAATPTVIDGKEWKPSGNAWPVDMTITVADQTHPITRDVAGFTVKEEGYTGIFVSPQVHVLLTTDNPRCSHALAWTNTYGKSRIFYLMPGHCVSTWNHPGYRALVRNGIAWASARTP